MNAKGEPNINLVVRLGGIYALEQIAKDSPKRYHWTVMEVLTTYVRVNSPVSVKDQAGPVKHSKAGTADQLQKPSNEQPTLHPDIQAILHVIGRRNIANDPMGLKIDLDHTDLRGANLYKAKLGGADLSGANLNDAKLGNAILFNADLRGAHLEKADLSTAIGLTDSQFIGTSGDKETKLPPGVHRPDAWTN